LRSNVKRFWGGKEEVIWVRALAYLAARAALAAADGAPVSQLISEWTVYRRIVNKQRNHNNQK
jgi:hypothetical protein